jgi:hypothetical protein
MITIDISEAEAKKFLASEEVKIINGLLTDENNIVGVSRMIYLNNEDMFVTMDIFQNDVNSSKIIYSAKGNLKLYDFRVQLLRELNKIGLVNKGGS